MDPSTALPPPLAPELLAGLAGLLTVALLLSLWFRSRRPAFALALLLWVAVAVPGRSLLAALGLPGAEAIAALSWQLLPWNLLLFSLLPAAAFRGRGGVALGALLAAQLAALVLLLPGQPTVPDLDAALLGRLPETVQPWLAPPGPIIALLCSVLLFARWRLTRDPRELGHFLLATAVLLALLAPAHAGAALAAAGLAGLATLALLAHRMAFRDALTGLENRRSLESALAGLAPPYAVAMVDIDHFKGINDRFGHDTGDRVLRLTARRLRAAGDYQAFRYGGEEFCLLFRGRRVAEARAACEAARGAVAEPPLEVPARNEAAGRRAKATRDRRRRRRGGERRQGPQHLTVTVSIGLAFPADGAAPAITLAAADKALYRAKRGGRDRVNVTGKAP